MELMRRGPVTFAVTRPAANSWALVGEMALVILMGCLSRKLGVSLQLEENGHRPVTGTSLMIPVLTAEWIETSRRSPIAQALACVLDNGLTRTRHGDLV